MEIRGKKKQENNENLGALIKYYQVIRRNMRWAGHVTRMRETRHAYKNVIWKHDEKIEQIYTQVKGYFQNKYCRERERERVRLGEPDSSESRHRPAAGCYGHGNSGRFPRRTEKSGPTDQTPGSP